jgi:hypothetical protein
MLDTVNRLRMPRCRASRAKAGQRVSVRMSSINTVWCSRPRYQTLIGVYVVGALSEILGLALTAKDVIVRFPGDGTIHFDTPKRWVALRGPGLIVFGILVGLAGNILWLSCP